MVNDGGLIATLEQAIADKLVALQNGGSNVFKDAISCAVWRHQLSASRAGIEAIQKYAPCCFVSYQSESSHREGGYDLGMDIDIAVLIGQYADVDGVARIGDASRLGTSKIRDLVIAALDRTHPGATFNCDDIIYKNATEVFDSPKAHLLQLNFTVLNVLGLS